jgi:hypothetical protein
VAKPSNTDLDRIAPHLFLFQDDAATGLPAFVADAALAAACQPVISDERFSDLAFAVVQHRAAGLRAFAHQPGQSWDIASTGKITILLGALTVLRDVEKLEQAGLLAGSRTRRWTLGIDMSGRATRTGQCARWWSRRSSRRSRASSSARAGRSG